MADTSQSEIDRQTIAAFETLWQETVIAGTSDSVKAAVAAALADLQRPAQQIADQALRLGNLGAQVGVLIEQRNASTDQLKEVARLAPNLVEKLGVLQDQFKHLSALLDQDQGWRNRLARWQEDRKLRETLVAIAAIPRAPDPVADTAGDDRHGHAPAPAEVASVAPEVGPQPAPLSKSGEQSGSNQRDRQRDRGMSWVKLALAAMAIAVLSAYVGGRVAQSRQSVPVQSDQPASLRTVPELTDEQAGLAEDQWNHLRRNEASKAKLATYCVGPCDPAGQALSDSFEAVWRSQPPERQRQLFREIVAVTESRALEDSQCTSLLARANLFDSAPEFFPQIAGCLVQQDFRATGQAIKADELYAVALQLLASREQAYLARSAEQKQAPATGSDRPGGVPVAAETRAPSANASGPH